MHLPSDVRLMMYAVPTGRSGTALASSRSAPGGYTNASLLKSSGI
jgi:hypothetical protein